MRYHAGTKNYSQKVFLSTDLCYAEVVGAAGSGRPEIVAATSARASLRAPHFSVRTSIRLSVYAARIVTIDRRDAAGARDPLIYAVCSGRTLRARAPLHAHARRTGRDV